MSFIDVWREKLKDSFPTFKNIAPQARSERIDMKHGFLAAALLWPIRNAILDEQARLTISAICKVQNSAILEMLSRWDNDPLLAARMLTQAAADNAELKVALDNLLIYFLDDLIASRLLFGSQTVEAMHIDAHNMTLLKKGLSDAFCRAGVPLSASNAEDLGTAVPDRDYSRTACPTNCCQDTFFQ